MCIAIRVDAEAVHVSKQYACCMITFLRNLTQTVTKKEDYKCKDVEITYVIETRETVQG